ncbi:MAG: hypothetical protein ACE361_16605 [Aureliella sp.]
MASSSPERESLDGVIRQDHKVVGNICLPEEDQCEFIEEFNHCYGPLNLHIDKPAYLSQPNQPLRPVGATRPRSVFYGPFPTPRDPNP